MKEQILKFPLVMLSLLLCISQPTFAKSLPDFPFVVTTGSAERSVKPDIATIRILVLVFHKDSAVALQQVAETSSKLTSLLRQLKIPLNALEASDLEKEVKRQRGESYDDLQVFGYEMSRTFTLQLTQLEHYPELADELLKLNHISGLYTRFDSSLREQLEAELVIAAAKDAAKQAERMAQSLGNKIHSVYAMSQASGFGNFFAAFGAREETYQAKAFNVGDNEKNLTMFIPKTIEIQQGINVVFRLTSEK
ncbi:SIMPL domain-containing protein [Rheinheimera riviphila]|nr:SIMPL domain-containing protein [Rheinheimera riviphila]